MSFFNNNNFLDGEKTQWAMEQPEDIPFDIDDPCVFIEGLEKLLTELSGDLFLFDWLKNYFQKNENKYEDMKIDTTDDMYNFVRKLFCDAGFVEKRSVQKKGKEFQDIDSNHLFDAHNLKEWIMGKKLIKKREFAYRLGFVLKLCTGDMTDLMRKACFMSPFNFKNIDESVYYFCLKEGKNYFDAKQIIRSVKESPEINNKFAINETRTIEKYIDNIFDEKELIAFLVENKEGFKFQYRSAVKELENQIKLSYFNIYDRTNKSVNDLEALDIKDISVSAVLKEITHCDPRHQENGKRIFSTIIESNLPKLIRTNFPSGQYSTQLIKPTNYAPSEDALRKHIILFTFYNFFCKKDDEGKYRDKNEFIDYLNSIFLKCGFVPLYARNPYDLMFIAFCIDSDPLSMFRRFMAEYDETSLYSECEDIDCYIKVDDNEIVN